MDNSNNRDVNPYVQRVNAPDGGADDLRENYTENYAGVGCNDLGCDNNSDICYHYRTVDSFMNDLLSIKKKNSSFEKAVHT